VCPFGAFAAVHESDVDAMADAFGDFASGSQSQLIVNFPDRNLVMALASGSSLPGGAAKFINEVVLPAEAALPAGAACLGHLDQ
jgi:hypothetical protein